MNGEDGTRRGFPWLVAIICFILGTMAGVVLTIGGLAVPSAFSKLTARTESRKVACANNLKQIGLAAQMYLIDHGVFPHAKAGDGTVAGRDHIQLLFDGEYLDDPEVVICPATKDPPPTLSPEGTWVLDDMTCSYLWARPAYDMKSPDTAPLAACRHPHFDAEGRNILYVLGNVEWMPEKEFQKTLTGSLTQE